MRPVVHICFAVLLCGLVCDRTASNPGKDAAAMAIVAAARSQIGVPYSFGGGGIQGKSRGIQQGANIEGFDCSSLTQYAVYKGTGKIIARTVTDQFHDGQCRQMPYEARKPGDLVFFEAAGHIHHVGIITGPNTMIHSPHSGDHVREASVYSTGLVKKVQRCAT